MKHTFSMADTKLLNDIFDVDELMKRVPEQMTPLMEEIDRERKIDREISYLGKFRKTMGWWKDRNMQRVATVPGPVWAVAKHLDPDIAKNKEKFYRWLAQHPAYDRRGKVG